MSSFGLKKCAVTLSMQKHNPKQIWEKNKYSNKYIYVTAIKKLYFSKKGCIWLHDLKDTILMTCPLFNFKMRGSFNSPSLLMYHMTLIHRLYILNRDLHQLKVRMSVTDLCKIDEDVAWNCFDMHWCKLNCLDQITAPTYWAVIVRVMYVDCCMKLDHRIAFM